MKPAETTEISASSIGNNTTSAPEWQNQTKKNSIVNLAQKVSTLLRANKSWILLTDDASGHTYYVDQSTGVSQWEAPPELIFPPHDSGVGEAIEYNEDGTLPHEATAVCQDAERFTTPYVECDPGWRSSESTRFATFVLETTSEVVKDKAIYPSGEEHSAGDAKLDSEHPVEVTGGARSENLAISRQRSSNDPRTKHTEEKEMRRVSINSSGTLLPAWCSPHTSDGVRSKRRTDST